MRLRDEKKAGALLLAALLLTGCGGAADTASNVEMGTAADAATNCCCRHCSRNLGACEHDL